jgi:hypothetical protein
MKLQHSALLKNHRLAEVLLTDVSDSKDIRERNVVAEAHTGN